MRDDRRDRSSDDDFLHYLEALLTSIVYGAVAHATTFVDFLFRARRFDGWLLAGSVRRDAPDAHRYMPPLTFLLLNQVFYFYVYPRQERGPTRAVIEAMPGPIASALDRIEASIREPNLVAVLLVVAPLLLMAAFHAVFTTWGFRTLRGSRVEFDTVLDVTCYSVGTMLAAVGLSAVLGATMTDRALGGELAAPALGAYLVLLVAPFLIVWFRCIGRHFAMLRAHAGASWMQTIAVVLGATLVLGLLVGSVLALGGQRTAGHARRGPFSARPS